MSEETAHYQETVCSTEWFPHCAYDAEAWTCQQNAAFPDPLAPFEALVWAGLVLFHFLLECLIVVFDQLSHISTCL